MQRAKSVTAEEAAVIEKMVRNCIRLLRRKEYELNLPTNAADIAVSHLRVYKRKRGVSRAGRNTIRICMTTWQIGKSHFDEYASFNEHPVIGRIATKDRWDTLYVVVAHEVAHYIQYTYAPRIRRFKKSYRKPHGDCFKAIYTYLRRDLVNPCIAARALL